MSTVLGTFLRLIFKRGLQFMFSEINFGEIPEEYLEPNRTYMAELFAKMSNGWKPLIFFAKSFIIDFGRLLKTPLDSWIFTWKVLTKVFLDLEFRLLFELVKEKLFHKKISFLPVGSYSCSKLSQCSWIISDGSVQTETLHKKWSFPLWISPVNVTKSTVSWGFGHIYWWIP